MGLEVSKEEIYKNWRIKIKIASFVLGLVGVFILVSSGGDMKTFPARVDLIMGLLVLGLAATIWFAGIKIIDYIDSKQRSRD